MNDTRTIIPTMISKTIRTMKIILFALANSSDSAIANPNVQLGVAGMGVKARNSLLPSGARIVPKPC